MKTNQALLLTADQAHWIIGRDNSAAAIAKVPEARAALPKLNRMRSWKETAFDPMSNALSNDIDIRNHDHSVTHLQHPIE
jgi:hypothetical protein